MNSDAFRQAFRFVALLLLSSLFLVACTNVPFEIDRPVDRALSTEDTSISRGLSTFIDGGDENTVLMAPLHDGNDGLAARFRLIELAERSIDIKTFLIKPDTAGTLLWLVLYEAAERGVKIRLLYDDVFTSANDASIATLNAHPNVDIRTFNPLSRNSSLAGNFIFDFKRVNRRMHNKAIIVDGVASIVGGRNIADEYYQIETSNEFADFDLLVAGDPVEELSKAFDLFWNDQWPYLWKTSPMATKVGWLRRTLSLLQEKHPTKLKSTVRQWRLTIFPT